MEINKKLILCLALIFVFLNMDWDFKMLKIKDEDFSFRNKSEAFEQKTILLWNAFWGASALGLRLKTIVQVHR